jgi:hypothetical protein
MSTRRTPEEESPFERQNLAQTTGQYYDMMRTESDDGTAPPTAEREAITAPPDADRDRAAPTARVSSTGAPQSPRAAPPADVSRRPETPLQQFAARGAAETSPEPDRIQVMEAKELIEEPMPSSAVAGHGRRPGTGGYEGDVEAKERGYE